MEKESEVEGRPRKEGIGREGALLGYGRVSERQRIDLLLSLYHCPLPLGDRERKWEMGKVTNGGRIL